MKRWLLNITTVLSLLLLLAAVGLWVDSYWSIRTVWFLGPSKELVAQSADGNCYFELEAYSNHWNVMHIDFGKTELILDDSTNLQQSGNLDWDAIGFGIGSWKGRNFGGPMSNYGIMVPLWFLTLIFAILPAIWLFKWNKRRKLSPNACPACGYDLTGNESGVCPECGATKAEAAQG